MNDSSRYGTVILRRDYETGEVEVVEAAPLALLTLDLLANADEASLRVAGDEVVIGSPRTAVHYRVIGWEPYLHALVIERQDQPR